MVIAVDFDGTCVTHEFPNVGKDIGAVPILRKIVENGHKLILFTMRSHPSNPMERDTLNEAIEWFNKNDIKLYGINENPSQKTWTNSIKPYANLYIDDASLGVPLLQHDINERPFVDWKRVEIFLQMHKII